MNSLELTKSLAVLAKMFEVGCELVVTQEKVVIKGYDFHPQNENFAIERTYEFDFEYNEEGQLVDTLSPVLSKIAEDAACSK